jgi:NitT/TauT family transport system ATP-binding protein
MEDDLLRLWELHQPAVVFITHDLEEAIGLSDRVVVMSASPGRVIGDYPITLARPRELLEIRFDAEFTSIYQHIWDQLRTEVVLANVD